MSRLDGLNLTCIEMKLAEHSVETLFHFVGPSGFADMVSAEADWSEYLSKNRVKSCLLTQEEVQREWKGKVPDVSPRYMPGTEIYWTGSRAKPGTDGREWKDREPCVDRFTVTEAVYHIYSTHRGSWIYTCSRDSGECRTFHDPYIGWLVFDTSAEAEDALRKSIALKEHGG